MTVFRPGELSAVAYRDGAAIGRTSLTTAGNELHLALDVDATEKGDVAFVAIELQDLSGTLHTSADRMVSVSIEGPGVLEGLGSAAPVSDESFLESHCRTYRGRALAVIRPTGTGVITITVTAEGLDSAALSIDVESPAGCGAL